MNLPQSREDQELLALLLSEQIRRQQQKRFYRMFPDEDGLDLDGNPVFAREKYVKHLEFFRAGATYRERLAMFGNRVGKTVAGAFETTCHLTGLYPEWWEGRRFATPVRWWAAGKTNETTRDIVQKELLGDIAASGSRKVVSGTGMVPGATIGGITWKQGVSDLVDTVKVMHVSGRYSILGFKSYQQGRGSFEGTAQHGAWLDEEPPIDIYGEVLIRTATTDGIVLTTFTPIEGYSETVKLFVPSKS